VRGRVSGVKLSLRNNGAALFNVIILKSKGHLSNKLQMSVLFVMPHITFLLPCTHHATSLIVLSKHLSPASRMFAL
jgi:hypothetical protein